MIGITVTMRYGFFFGSLFTHVLEFRERKSKTLSLRIMNRTPSVPIGSRFWKCNMVYTNGTSGPSQIHDLKGNEGGGGSAPSGDILGAVRF